MVTPWKRTSIFIASIQSKAYPKTSVVVVSASYTLYLSSLLRSNPPFLSRLFISSSLINLSDRLPSSSKIIVPS